MIHCKVKQIQVFASWYLDSYDLDCHAINRVRSSSVYVLQVSLWSIDSRHGCQSVGRSNTFHRLDAYLSGIECLVLSEFTQVNVHTWYVLY